jgi:hypothetical protein
MADHNRGSQMDKELKSRFEQALQQYADIIRERDAALLREKTTRPDLPIKARSGAVMTLAVDSEIGSGLRII